MSVSHALQPLAVLGGARTPFAKAFGVFDSLQADALGVAALKGAFKASHVSPEAIDEVVFGNVATPVHAANIARVIAIESGVGNDKPAHTVSRNCASGMEAIVGAWHAIHEGRASVVATGGVESMSNIPFQFSKDFQNWMIDWKKKKGFGQFSHLASFRPTLLKPVVALQVGLTDPTCGLNMGETAEILAEEFQISRESQDQFAVDSHHGAAAAWERCFLGGETIEVTVGKDKISRDNGVRPKQTMEALAKLKPVFKKGGSVTAGNSSQLTDGGCTMVVSTPVAAARFGVTPLGTIHAYTVAGLDPSRMGLGPVYAIHKLLEKTGMQLSDFDLFEINEAFAAQVLACLKAMESPEFCRHQLQRSQAIGAIRRDRLNVNGGAIALGHPLGATGNRLVLTLLRSLKERGLRHGLAALCIGGGQGMAMWVERNPDATA
ncbi:thiolase family protein [Planctomicrobium piriforme]|uniref:Acetyl-CoA C-acetyltransferase/acetyl-CoA acyltransferase n=1 Tax=Planctomicrobium piriforme TaxID=1576369 RepID=A0A1I3L1H4_9PLAN|nr:thiolase family protein [Planctomicrobium piriforme]SFI78245.1 acetyl-CoA C-acetyltransferase/acetyl-CoA acyltransferase [Planctomicrobium piriforme]